MMKNLRNILLIIIVFAFSQNEVNAQAEKVKYNIYSVAFYNLENFFDTINDPLKRDEDFLPTGSYKWTSKRYNLKLKHMAKVVSKLGVEKTGGIPPTIVGFSELENQQVIQDLIDTAPLNKYPYKIAHVESPDHRGVDVALIYRSDIFEMDKFYARELWVKNAYKNFATRNQLVVEGMLAGEKTAFLVNHWPSRAAGSRYREAAGALNRTIIDSLRSVYPGIHCITMGDLNDDPSNKSLTKGLGAVGDKEQLSDKNILYNPMVKMHKKGLGTLAYRDGWNLFDQIIFTKELALKKDKTKLMFYKAEICSYDFLKNKSGRYKGYPFRTYAGGNYAGGYSDHFPVVTFFVKQK